MKIRLVIFFALILAAMAQIAYYLPHLPSKIASHFELSGKVVAWMPKEIFMGVYGGTILLMGFVFILAPWLTFKLPTWTINIPNKGFWLTPSRIQETKERFSMLMLEMGTAIVAFLLFTFQNVIESNLRGSALDTWSICWALGAFLTISVIWVLRFFRAFRIF